MGTFLIFFIVASQLVIGQSAVAATAQESSSEEWFTDDEVVLRPEGGHYLKLPKDWPVKREGGVISPASVEEYLSMKFQQVRDKVGEMDHHLEALEHRIATLEEERRALQMRLRLLEERAEHAEVRHGNAQQQTLEAGVSQEGQPAQAGGPSQ